MRRNSKGFTPHDIETAIKVLIKSSLVQEWIEGEARAFGVDLNTPTGKRFAEREGRRQAERLIK